MLFIMKPGLHILMLFLAMVLGLKSRGELGKRADDMPNGRVYLRQTAEQSTLSDSLRTDRNNSIPAEFGESKHIQFEYFTLAGK